MYTHTWIEWGYTVNSVISGSGKGLMSNRRQNETWVNDGYVLPCPWEWISMKLW